MRLITNERTVKTCSLCRKPIELDMKCWQRAGGIYTSYTHTNCSELESTHQVTERFEEPDAYEN